ncbi:MAG: 50S ribosomal protein L15 [Magnetococcales bacterium]|nr:50S ribosomal protein L15 [Magnetococcales bacterium]
MKLNELPKNPAGARGGKRVGRGIGSGHGKTSCRGQKGQRARSGGYHKIGFEGGQMPLQRRLPKRGFKNPFRKIYALVNLQDLDLFDAGMQVGIEDLKARGIIGRERDGVKLLAEGEISKPLYITVDRASVTAIEKVRAAGGSVTLNHAVAVDETHTETEV